MNLVRWWLKSPGDAIPRKETSGEGRVAKRKKKARPQMLKHDPSALTGICALNECYRKDLSFELPFFFYYPAPN